MFTTENDLSESSPIELCLSTLRVGFFTYFCVNLALKAGLD